MTYTSGLRLRVPEPLPECEDGETPQQYFARILAQTAIESATSAENTSGDSAPTPFNLGQVQLDVSNLQTDVDELQTDMTSAQATISTHTSQIATLQAEVISVHSDMVDIPTGATSVTVLLPDSGTWSVVGMPGTQVLGQLRISEVTINSFTATWQSAVTAGATFYYIAHRRA